MPWCPKCKSEYREGVTFCEDCKVELVDSLSDEPELVDLALLEKKAVADKFLKYLEYSDIYAKVDFSDENSAYIIRVKEKDAKKAKKHFVAFSTVEAEQSVEETKSEASKEESEKEADPYDWDRSDEDTDNIEQGSYDINTEEEQTDVDSDQSLNEEDGFTSVTDDEVLYPESVTYVKKSEQTKDLRLTATTFLTFGAVGIIYLILNIIGVFSLSTGIVTYVVMGILFTGFIAVGINSYQRSKKAAVEAVQEEEMTNSLNAWLDQHITKETLNEIKTEYITSMHENDISDEIIYLKQIYAIKKKIIEEFGDIDDAYLETIVEEYYTEHFTEQDEVFIDD